jgi:hypothetical protein
MERASRPAARRSRTGARPGPSCATPPASSSCRPRSPTSSRWARSRSSTKPENEKVLEGDAAVSVAKLWAKLDEHDDVQKCHTNASLPDDVMEEHGP